MVGVWNRMPCLVPTTKCDVSVFFVFFGSGSRITGRVIRKLDSDCLTSLSRFENHRSARTASHRSKGSEGDRQQSQQRCNGRRSGMGSICQRFTVCCPRTMN